MNAIFETLATRARDCQQLVADIDLIRPVTYETDPSLDKLAELVCGAAALYELRFAALLDAYEEAIADKKFYLYDMEERAMRWWGVCDDLRHAVEGAQAGILDNDGFDNVLLGVASLSRVHAARFFALLESAKAAPIGGQAPEPESDASGPAE